MKTKKNWDHHKRAMERFQSIRLLVIGDIMQDRFIWGRVKRISPEAPVPVVEVERQTVMLGGAANVVNNLVALGAKAAMAGVIGQDRPAQSILSQLDQAGVDRTCVIEDPGRPTTVKTRIIAHNQQVVRFDHESRKVISEKALAQILQSLQEVIKNVQGVIISDYAKGLICRELAERVISLARKQEKPVCVDPKVVNLDYYQGAQIVTPNQREAEEATGMEIETETQLAEAGRRLLDRLNCRAVLITRGENGMSLFESGQDPFHVPAEAREVFDVTGAGDTVIGVLALGLASGLTLRQAVELSNLAAGIVVGKLGTSVVNTKELAEALDNGGL